MLPVVPMPRRGDRQEDLGEVVEHEPLRHLLPLLPLLRPEHLQDEDHLQRSENNLIQETTKGQISIQQPFAHSQIFAHMYSSMSQ